MDQLNTIKEMGQLKLIETSNDMIPNFLVNPDILDSHPNIEADVTDGLYQETSFPNVNAIPTVLDDSILNEVENRMEKGEQILPDKPSSNDSKIVVWLVIIILIFIVIIIGLAVDLSMTNEKLAASEKIGKINIGIIQGYTPRPDYEDTSYGNSFKAVAAESDNIDLNDTAVYPKPAVLTDEPKKRGRKKKNPNHKSDPMTET